jgi:hypothetical protein
MADEPERPGRAGTPSPNAQVPMAEGNHASTGANGGGGRDAQNVADETRLIAAFHLDAERDLEILADRTGKVGRLVEAFGHADCEEIRRELERLTDSTVRRLHLQFADLASGEPRKDHDE